VERFDESLLLWKRWTGVGSLDVGYRPVNVARSNAVRQEVLSDPDTEAAIRRFSRQDEKLYRYVVDEFYPRQVAAYGSSLADDLRSFQSTLARGTNFSCLGLVGKAKRDLFYKPLMRIARSAHRAA
jgi:hypothetical protein